MQVRVDEGRLTRSFRKSYTPMLKDSSETETNYFRRNKKQKAFPYLKFPLLLNSALLQRT
jgi:hypothetical protein